MSTLACSRRVKIARVLRQSTAHRQVSCEAPGRDCDVVVAVGGNSIRTCIDGQPVNRVTVDTPPRGGIGLAVMGRNTVAGFRDPMVRHHCKEKS